MSDLEKKGLESLFVPYEIALDMKSIGFNETCLATIDQTEYVHIKGTKKPPRGSMMYDNIDCPAFSQAFRWLCQKLDIEKSSMPLDTEYQQILLKELIEIVKNNLKNG